MKTKPSTFLFRALLGAVMTLFLVGVTDGLAEARSEARSETTSETTSETRSQSPKRADSVDAVWQKFKDAVLKGDKETVARLTRFPMSRGYGMASIRSKAQFMRRYRDLFFNETNAAQCFPKAKPVVDRERPNEFSVSCPFAQDSSGEEPFVYTFTRTRAGWKLTSFENINE